MDSASQIPPGAAGQEPMPRVLVAAPAGSPMASDIDGQIYAVKRSAPLARRSTPAGWSAALASMRVLVVAPKGAIPTSEFDGIARIVAETSDPFEAVFHIKAKSADLVVIDFALPRDQGPALLTLVRAQSTFPS